MDPVTWNGMQFVELADDTKIKRCNNKPRVYTPRFQRLLDQYTNGIHDIEETAGTRKHRAVNKDYGEDPPTFRQLGDDTAENSETEYRDRHLPKKVEIEDPLLGTEVDTYA